MKFAKILIKKYLPSILTGLLIILSSPGANIPIFKYTLHWIALVPLFLVILTIKKTKEIYKATFVVSFILFGYSWIWFFDTLPLNWAGLKNPIMGFLVVLFFWFVIVAFSSFLFSIWSIVFVKLKNKFYNPLLFALSWTAMELIYSFGFSIYSLGDGSRIGEFYSFGSLGYHLHNVPFLSSWSSLGGIQLLTFLIVLVNGMLVEIIILHNKKLSKQKIKNIKVLIVFVLLVCIFGKIIHSLNAKISFETKNIEVVQTNTPNDVKLDHDYMKQQNEYFYKIIKDINSSSSPDIILLPESSFFLNNIDNVPKAIVRDYVSELLNNKNTILIVNNHSVRVDSKFPKNITYSVNGTNGILGEYTKSFLTPLGENVPYLVDPFIRKLFSKSLSAQEFDKYRRYQSSVSANALPIIDEKYSAITCSEIFSVSIARKVTNDGGKIILVPANLSVFNKSKMLFNYSEAAAKIRAIENNRYLVQASNAGYSYVISNTGEVIKKSPSISELNFDKKVKLMSNKTIYTKYGNWIGWLSVFVLLISLLKKRNLYQFYKKTKDKRFKR